jgi:putative SOS response-associated peptidase YedK
MCGRYSFFTPLPDAALYLDAQALAYFEFPPNYNAPPTQMMPVITNEFPGVIQFFRWGLVPKWAKEMAVGYKMINTRSESIRDKPAFRNIFKYKRCIVPADGYYEWKKEGKIKVPYRFHLPGNALMLLAGLWDTWGEGLQTFSIITTEANADVAHIHDRMPVLLTQDEARLWLSNDIHPDELLTLLRPAPIGLLQSYTVSTRLNSAVNNEPTLIDPVEFPL